MAWKTLQWFKKCSYTIPKHWSINPSRLYMWSLRNFAAEECTHYNRSPELYVAHIEMISSKILVQGNFKLHVTQYSHISKDIISMGIKLTTSLTRRNLDQLSELDLASFSSKLNILNQLVETYLLYIEHLLLLV